MKIIDDRTVFGSAKLPLDYKSDGGEFFYRKSSCFSRQSPLFVEPPSRELLFASGIYEGGLLPGAHYLRRNAAFLSVEYIREGNLYVRLDGQMYELGAGEIFLMHPFRTAEFATGRKYSCHKVAVTMHGELLVEFLRRSGIDRMDVQTEVNSEKIEDIIARFQMLSDRHGRDVERSNGLLCYELLQFLQAPHRVKEQPPLLQEILEYMAEHLAEPVRLEDLTELFGCSRTGLIGLFRDNLHETPHQALINLRMRRARELLRTREGLSIKEITMQTGYSNALNFSTEFKKRFKMSPREYRRMKL